MYDGVDWWWVELVFHLLHLLYLLYLLLVHLLHLLPIGGGRLQDQLHFLEVCQPGQQ